MPAPIHFIRQAYPGAQVGYGAPPQERQGEVERKIYMLETTDATLQEIFIDGVTGKTLTMIDGDFIHLCQVYAAAKRSDAAGGGEAKWFDATKYRAEKIGGVVTTDYPGIQGPGNNIPPGNTLFFGLDADPGNVGIRAQVQGNNGENWRWIVVVEYVRVNYA